MKEGLSWIKGWRKSNYIFESNAKLLVDALNGSRERSYFDTIVTDCIQLFKHFEEVLVVFVHRSANNVANLLANLLYVTYSGVILYYSRCH